MYKHYVITVMFAVALSTIRKWQYAD